MLKETWNSKSTSSSCDSDALANSVDPDDTASKIDQWVSVYVSVKYFGHITTYM